MNVVVDGIIYQIQKRGGISRIFNELLLCSCELEHTIRFQMFTTGRAMQALPIHSQIKHYPPAWIPPLLIPNRIWQPIIEKAIRPLEKYSISNIKDAIWHSTYYTRPIKWRGCEVVTVFDMIHEHFPKDVRDRDRDQLLDRKRQCILNADAIICISDATKNDIEETYRVDVSKLHVVPLAANKKFKCLDERSRNYDSLIGQPYLLYVGDRIGYKNFYNLIHAYSLWKYRNEVALVVVGSKWERGERKEIESLGIKDRVQLFEKADDERLVILYNQASAFIHSSLYEGFGLPLLEAMACGCPIVASRIPSTVEVAGDVPIYFDPRDCDSIIDALNKVVMGGEVSEKTRLGLERVKRYSWDRSARLTLDVYRSFN